MFFVFFFERMQLLERFDLSRKRARQEAFSSTRQTEGSGFDRISPHLTRCAFGTAACRNEYKFIIFRFTSPCGAVQRTTASFKCFFLTKAVSDFFTPLVVRGAIAIGG